MRRLFAKRRDRPERPAIEELEPKILYSADMVAALAECLEPTQSAEMRVMDNQGEFIATQPQAADTHGIITDTSDITASDANSSPLPPHTTSQPDTRVDQPTEGNGDNILFGNGNAEHVLKPGEWNRVEDIGVVATQRTTIAAGQHGLDTLGFATGFDLRDGDLATSVPSDPSLAIDSPYLGGRREIAFVDPHVADYRQLVDDLIANAEAAGRSIDVVVLDPTNDGILQVNAALAGREAPFDVLHFITHGTDGAVRIGDTWLREHNLDEFAAGIASWKGGLADDAQLLFYGCDVADNTEGRALVDALRTLTGANVAASTNLTGNAGTLADWTLEYSAGSIDASVVLSPVAASTWSGVLATLTVTNTADVVDGNTASIASLVSSPGTDGKISLREAIIAANNTAGADQILLPTGTYTLTLAGAGEELAATGDLDIRGDVTIAGAGAGSTIIDGNALDRVFDVRSGTVAIQSITIQNGFETAAGGAGVQNLAGASLSLTGVVIAGNSAGSKDGGGLANLGSATIASTAISGGTALRGGGIFNAAGANLTLMNTTVSGNTASGDGGGVANFAVATVTNSTITANSAAANGGGIFAASSTTTTLANTLIAGNTAGSGSDLSGTVVSSGGNLIGNTAGGNGWAASDLQNVSPLLDATLKNNGGTTPTHALLAGSPAINAGTAAGAPADDQRGFVRVGSTDIGAYEFGAVAPPPNTAPTLDATPNPVLTAVDEDAGVPSGVVGTLVSSLVDFSGGGGLDNVNDPDAGTLLGIAVTGADTSHGNWWYSLDNGATWSTFGAVSEQNARLLPADAGTRIYFQPSADYSGTLPAALTFHAWDRTDGMAGDTAFLSDGAILLDTFTNVSYANNNGTQAWSGPWVESDSSGGGASGGRILVSGGQLDFRAFSAGDSIARAANIGGATVATLSFSFDNQLSGNDIVAVQVSNNGGSSYTTLAGGTFSSSLQTGSGTASYDISAWATSDTRVRFLVVANDKKKDLYLDNVRIDWSNVQTGGSTAFSTASDTASITVNSFNDAPSIALPAPQSVAEDSTLVLSTATGNEIIVGDVDSGNSPVQATLSATQGTLTLTPLLGTEFQVNITTASNQQTPRVAVAPDGHYVVVWQSNNQDGSKNGIYARVYNADGTARTAEIAVNTLTADDQTAPAIAIDASGRFVIAWQNNDPAVGGPGWDIYARTFNADGTALSAQVRINSTTANDQTAPAVSMDGAGNIVVAWQSKGQDNADGKLGIYARLYAIDLTAASGAYLVNTTTIDDQTSPVIAASSLSGDFVVAWESKSQDGSGLGIYAQRYTATGVRVGGEFLVNATTASDQSSPTVAMNASGNFVVAWQSKGQDNSPETGKFGIYARRYDASGAAQGGEFLVNTTIANDQTTPSVAMTDTGDFAVAWTSTGQDNADGKEGVYVQGFAADGSFRGQEFRANTTTLDAQSAPSLGVTPDGNLVVVWQSQNQDGNGSGVFGQRFKPPGALTFLTGDGVADASMTVSGTIAAIASYLDGMIFTPLPNYAGPASIAIAIDDLGNSGVGGSLSASAVLAIDVTPVNDPPTQELPGAQVTDEDTPVVLSAANGNAISVADIDAAPGPLQVTLAATNGTVTLASLAGLTITAGADGTALVTVRGSASALNAALDGMTYTPVANYFGADTLTVTTSDLGNTGAGGPLSVSGSIALTINSVNDAPVNVLPATQSTPEGSVLTLSNANGNAVRLTDVDAFAGIEEVTLVATHGTLKLARTTNLSFSLGNGKGGETRMTFRGTLVNINAALDGLQFTPDSGYAGPAYLEMLASDLGNTGASTPLGDRDVLRIDIVPDANNAAPVVIVPPNQTTLEETTLTLSSATGNAIKVNDDAGGNPIKVTLSVTGGTLTLSTSTGPETLVNSTVLGDQQSARVAMNPTGDYVVVWQSAGQDRGGQGIYAQRYNAEGLALAPEFRVNTTTAGDQSSPAIAMDAVGNYVVVWQSKSQDGDGWGIYGQRYSADGVAQGGEFRVNTTTVHDQSVPAIAMDAVGNFVVVWQSDRQDGDGWGLYAQRYSADGAAQGGEFRVNTTTAKHQTAPSVAMNAAGSFAVAWQSENQDGDGLGIYAQRYDAAGIALSGEFRVNTIIYKEQTSPAIAMNDAGAFVVVWQSQDIDYNDGKFGTYAQRYDTTGTALGTQFLVNSTTPNEQINPSVAIDSGGGFIVAWQAINQDNPDHKAGIYAQRFDAAGTPVATEFLVNTTTLGHQTSPAVGLADNGRFVVIWTAENQDGDGKGVYAQRYFDPRFLSFTTGDGIDDTAMAFAGTLDQINDALDGLVFTPAKDFDGNARLDISANDLGNSGSGGPRTTSKNFTISVQPVNDAPTIQVPATQTLAESTSAIFSAATSTAITIGDVDAGNNKLAVTLSATTGLLTLANTAHLTFTAGDGVADATMTFTAKLVDLAAALDGLRLDFPTAYTGNAAVQVYVSDQGNTGAGGALTAAATAFVTIVPDAVNSAPRVAIPGPQYTPQDTALALSAATTNRVSVIDDAGAAPVTVTLNVSHGTLSLSNAVGPEIQANTYVTSGQDSARLAMMPNGDYLVVWRSNGQDLSGTGVYAQRFNAAGLAVGAELRVNTTTANNQWAPAVAVNRSGEFVIAWVSDSQDGSGRGVYLQRFDAAGNRLGGEVLANTEIAGDQDAPAVAISDSGAFVVVWESADADQEGIFAQLFDANGNQQGNEFQVNVTTSGRQTSPDVAMDGAGNFVVAWQSPDANSEGVYARRFAADGIALGTEFRVNATTAGSQSIPSVAMNATGSFVIAWQGPETGNGTGIYAQRYDATGTALGAETLVNSTAAGNQILPRIAMSDSGEFVVAWQSPDSNNQGVFAQAFHADGTKLGREVRINTTTQGNQEAPSVGMAANGTYAAAWTSDNLDGNNSGIAVQRMLRGDELTYTAGSGVNDTLITVTGTLADINAALDGMMFTPAAGFNGIASIHVDVNDLGHSGTGGALTAQTTLDIAVGKAPVMDLDANDSSGAQGSAYSGIFRPGLGAVAAADADAMLADATSGNLLSLTVQITNLLNFGSETLAVNTGGTNILQTYLAGTLSLFGIDSVANYQKVLRTITYNNTAGSPNLADRLITFQAFDGLYSSNVATATLHFPGGNAAPVATADSYTVDEDGTLNVPASGVLANDSDPNSDPLTASLVSGASNGSLTLNADGSFDYTPGVNFSGSDSFSYRAFDGLSYSTAVIVTIGVTAVNDAPSGADKTVTTLEDTDYVFTTADFGFTDPNDTPANTLANVRITTLSGGGTLKLSGVGVTAGQFVSAADITAGNLRFTPAGNANGAGYAGFTFQVQDDGATSNGGVDLDASPNTITINVTAVNDAPSGADKTVTTLEDTDYVFTTADFGFTDPNDSPGNALANVKITTLPTAGSLTLSGSAVTSGQFISAANITDGNLRFTPAGNANGAGYAGFTFQVQDDGATSNGGVDLDASANTITINVTAVNDAPSGADKTVTTLEDTDYVFTTADFGFTDPNDSPGNALANVKITTLPTAGSLTLSGSAVTSGQFISAANIAAGKLKFAPAPGAGGTGYASFTFQVQDDGGTTNNGVDLDGSPDTITVNVTSVNDAPVNTVPRAQSTLVNTAVVFSTGNGNAIAVGDVDAGSASLEVTLTAADGTLSLGGPTGTLSFSAGTGTLDATMTFTGSIADINAALEGMVFDPTPGYTGSTTISVTVSDLGNSGSGGAKTDHDTVVVNVSMLNTAPNLAGTNDMPPTDEDVPDGGTLVSTLISGMVTDPDAGALAGIAVTAVDATHGDWQYTTNGGATWASLADVTASNARLLAADANTSVRFVASPDWNGTVTNGLTFRAWDRTSGAAGARDDTSINGGISAFSAATASSSITVNAVNDAPSGTDKTIAVLEDTEHVFTAADFGFTDPNDTSAHALLAVKIATLPAAGSLTLNGNNIAAGQFISRADIDNGLLAFTPSANQSGAGYASFTFQVQDDGGATNGNVDLDASPNTITINVTAVNDAPSGADKTVTTPEDTDYVFTTDDFGFTDPNDTPANALANVRITTLPPAGSLTLNGNNVAAGQFISRADIDNGLLTFTPSANQSGAGYASFTFQVQDDGGATNGNVDLDASPNTITINVTAVNDAPSGAYKTVTTLEDTDYVFTTDDFGFTDPNDTPANALANVRITTLPPAGSLTLNGNNVAAGQFISRADIDNGLLAFTPDANQSGAGYASFTFQVQDDGGGIDLDPTARTMTIDVLHVNHAPTGASTTVTMPESTTYVLTVADFGFSDPNDTPADALSAVKITTLPGAGVLTLSGAAVTAGQTVAATDIDNGQLVYTAPPDLNGASVAAFTFRVQDDGSTAYGSNLDAIDRTIGFDILPVNDAPVRIAGNVTDVTIHENYGYVSLGLTGLDYAPGGSDEASQSLTFTVTALPPASLGTMLLADGVTPVSLGGYTLAEIQGMQFRTAPDTSGGPAAFTFTVQDDGRTDYGGIDTLTQTLWVTVTPISHAPLGQDFTATTPEDTPYVFAVSDFGFSDPNDTPPHHFSGVKISTLPATGTLALNGAPVAAGDVVTVANIAAGRFSFAPAANQNGTSYASFTFQVRDDGDTDDGGVDLDASPNTVTVNVTAVNDAPALAGADSLTYFENQSATAINSGITVNDPDNATLASAMVAITANYVSGEDVLGFINVPATMGNIAGSYDSTTGVLTLTSAGQTATQAEWQAALRTVTYFNTSDAPSALPRTVDYVINDGSLNSNAVSSSVTLVASNDAPTISGTATGQSVTDLASLNPFSTVTIGDVDLPAQTLGVSVQLDVAAKGSFSSLNGFIDAGGGLYTFRGTAAQATSALHGLLFTPANSRVPLGSTETTRFTITVDDGAGGTAGDANTTVIATAVNHAPIGSNRFITLEETAVYTFTLADFRLADGDVPAQALLAVRIDGLSGEGTLSLDGSPVVAGQIVSAGDIAAGKLTFKPNGDVPASGFTAFTFRVQDNGGTVDGGIDLDLTARTMNFDVNSGITPSIIAAALNAGAISTPATSMTSPTDIAPGVREFDGPKPDEGNNGPVPATIDSVAPKASATNLIQSDDDNAVSLTPEGKVAPTFQGTSVSGSRNYQSFAQSFMDPGLTRVLPISGSVEESGTTLQTNFVESASKIMESQAFLQELNRVREGLLNEEATMHQIVASGFAVSTGLSVGYVAWLLRGGVLLSGVLSSMPAWRMIDPLPVLARTDRDMRPESDDSDDSLEALVDDDDRAFEYPHDEDSGKDAVSPSYGRQDTNLG